MAIIFSWIFLHFEGHIFHVKDDVMGNEALLIMALFGQVEGNVNKKYVGVQSLGAYLDLCMLK